MNEDKKNEYVERYRAALHAMQAGVAMMMNYDNASVQPKHLRVGVNSAMVNDAALVKILISKGILTEEEYVKAVAEQMEEERDSYKKMIEDHLGTGVKIDLV